MKSSVQVRIWSRSRNGVEQPEQDVKDYQAQRRCSRCPVSANTVRNRQSGKRQCKIGTCHSMESPVFSLLQPGTLFVCRRRWHKGCHLFDDSAATKLPYVTQYCCRDGDRVSGPGTGPPFQRRPRRPRLRPRATRTEIRPGSRISGPEALLRNIG